MLFILEIVLTIIAWRKGWNWKSLLPMLIAFFMGVFMGSVALATGNTLNASSLIIWDILATITLIVMCFVSPEAKKEI